MGDAILSVIRLRQVDQNFDHIDVGHVALSPRVDAPLLDERRDERDLAREFASAKRGGTHQHRLPDLDFPEIALVQFRAHAQRRHVANDQQRLRIGGRGQFTGFAIDLQHGAGDGRADRQLCKRRGGRRRFSARYIDLAFRKVGQRGVGVGFDTPQLRLLLLQAILRP